MVPNKIQCLFPSYFEIVVEVKLLRKDSPKRLGREEMKGLSICF